jgi:hypothetical protein
MSGRCVWQRNYYERVVRNDDELSRIREYVRTNPLRWESDRENPCRVGRDELEGLAYGEESGGFEVIWL